VLLYRNIAVMTAVPIEVLIQMPPGAFDQLCEGIVRRDASVLAPEMRG
jgi:hypothetical protein